MKPAWIYVVLGLALFLAVILPPVLDRWKVNAPIVLVTLGLIVGVLPGFRGLNLDPVTHGPAITHITEFTVLVSLMGVGLALDRPLSFRDLSSWRSWSPTWRLLGIAMPADHRRGGAARVGAVRCGRAGSAPPRRRALRPPTRCSPPTCRSVAPTTRTPPTATRTRCDEEDEVRFALTSEAGLNDGLAFPFVHAAILLATVGAFSEWGAGWVAWERVGKIVLGVAVGVGRRLGGRPVGVHGAVRGRAVRRDG